MAMAIILLLVAAALTLAAAIADVWIQRARYRASLEREE